MKHDYIPQAIEELSKGSGKYRFPRWDEFPNVDLYMDQVIELMNRYRVEFEAFGLGAPEITPAMINNYVKARVMPRPVKKRYSRLHLAYIMVICTLKNTFSLSAIKAAIPTDAPAEEAARLYDIFAETQEAAYSRALEGLSVDGGETYMFLLRLLSNVNMRKTLAENLAGGAYVDKNQAG